MRFLLLPTILVVAWTGGELCLDRRLRSPRFRLPKHRISSTAPPSPSIATKAAPQAKNDSPGVAATAGDRTEPDEAAGGRD